MFTITVTVNDATDALVMSKVLAFYADLVGDQSVSAEEQEADHEMLVAEQRAADTADIAAGVSVALSEADTQTSDKPKRTRRTKAQMEAARIAEASASQVDPGAVLAERFPGSTDIAIGGPAMIDSIQEVLTDANGAVVEDHGADLYSQLVSDTVTLVTPPPFDRDAAMEQAKVRAKSGIPGGKWLVEHVLCGSKFQNLSAVPDAVLAAALAVPVTSGSEVAA